MHHVRFMNVIFAMGKLRRLAIGRHKTPNKANKRTPMHSDDAMAVEDTIEPSPVDDRAKEIEQRKERVLVLCTRGTAARYRHLMLDLVQLLPHCKKESKLDVKRDFKIVADIAEIKSCTSAILFECRKFKDLYIWMSKTPNGPSIKFAAQNSCISFTDPSQSDGTVGC